MMAPQDPMEDAKTLGTMVRTTELVGSFFVIASVAAFLYAGVPSGVTDTFVLVVAIFFFVPSVLSVTALVAVMTDTMGIGSLVAGALALVTISTVAVSILALVAPTGGIYGGYIFSYASALLLSVAVLLRPTLNQLFSRLWLRPRLVG